MNLADLSPTTWVAKAEAALIGFLVVAVVVAGATSCVYSRGLADQKAKDAPVVAQAKGEAAVAGAQASAAGEASTIFDTGARRQAAAAITHEENAHAIAAAPGAGVGLDPRLNDAGRHGLCRYAAYVDDPGCAGLREPDPGQLPQAGSGGVATARSSDGR